MYGTSQRGFLVEHGDGFVCILNMEAAIRRNPSALRHPGAGGHPGLQTGALSPEREFWCSSGFLERNDRFDFLKTDSPFGLPSAVSSASWLGAMEVKAFDQPWDLMGRSLEEQNRGPLPVLEVDSNETHFRSTFGQIHQIFASQIPGRE